MSIYIYEQPDGPNFRWDQDKLSTLLASVRHQQGRLIGRMESLGFHLREEAVLQTLTLDVVKSSEIEGEMSVRGAFTKGRRGKKIDFINSAMRVLFLEDTLE